MTASSTLLALFLMPLCLWIYSRHWINTAVVQLLPLGAVSLTLGSTLLPIGLGVLIRYRHPRAADLLVKVGTAPGGEEGGHTAGDARRRHRGRGADGSKLSCPSKPVLVSHRHSQLLRWSTRTYSPEIKRWDRESEGKGRLPPFAAHRKEGSVVGILHPVADAFRNILLSPHSCCTQVRQNQPAGTASLRYSMN